MWTDAYTSLSNFESPEKKKKKTIKTIQMQLYYLNFFFNNALFLAQLKELSH